MSRPRQPLFVWLRIAFLRFNAYHLGNVVDERRLLKMKVSTIENKDLYSFLINASRLTPAVLLFFFFFRQTQLHFGIAITFPLGLRSPNFPGYFPVICCR
ncbi:hypothetical protein F4801DRAFT_294143 [Xylaria longipes]|nr:hypothetical protein F4801DRAFT_294143 [Xylaria longipes]